jgi:hypothetical protein
VGFAVVSRFGVQNGTRQGADDDTLLHGVSFRGKRRATASGKTPCSGSPPESSCGTTIRVREFLTLWLSLGAPAASQSWLELGGLNYAAETPSRIKPRRAWLGTVDTTRLLRPDPLRPCMKQALRIERSPSIAARLSDCPDIWRLRG